jgi:general secretion pathway protein D
MHTLRFFNAIMPQMRVFMDKRLNALTVQARASDLPIAQRIVSQLDKAKAEVVVYLELVEVSETGEVNIGEKVSTTQTQYRYEDVGVKIKVKPRVHFNGDITIDLESEIRTRIGGVQGRPDLGQRIIKTSARLRDGETAIFGGLLKEDETRSLQGLWGLSDLPILGRLFGNNRKDKSRTDMILTLRAVVVRKPDLVESDFAPFDPDQTPTAIKPFAPGPEPAPLPQGLREESGPPAPATVGRKMGRIPSSPLGNTNPGDTMGVDSP